MTPAWLTDVLCRHVQGAPGKAANVTGGGEGTTARGAVEVGDNERGKQVGSQMRLFTKCTPHFRSRLQQASIAKPSWEVRFYNHLSTRIAALPGHADPLDAISALAAARAAL